MARTKQTRHISPKRNALILQTVKKRMQKKQRAIPVATSSSATAKHRRWRPGTVAKREIRKLSRSTNLLFPKLPFNRLVISFPFLFYFSSCFFKIENSADKMNVCCRFEKFVKFSLWTCTSPRMPCLQFRYTYYYAFFVASGTLIIMHFLVASGALVIMHYFVACQLKFTGRYLDCRRQLRCL